MNKSRGFTLTELLVTIAVFAILASFAVPSFVEMIANSKIDSISRDLRYDLQTAQLEARKRYAIVRVCADGGTGVCNGSADWSQGWIVIAPTGAPIRQHGPIGAGYILTNLAGNFAFGSQGYPNGAAETWMACRAGSVRKLVAVNAAGSVSINRGAPC